MALESDADRLDMLSVLGEEITFKGSPIQAIFDADYFEIQGGEVGVEGSQPGVECRSSDVSGVVHGDSVVRSGDSYKVVGIKPDGTGMTALVLEFLQGISVTGGFSTGFTDGFA